MKKQSDLSEYDIMKLALSEEETILSKQRTQLAFIQTGLAGIGVGLVVFRFWEGAFFQGIALLLVIYGFYEIVRSYRKLGEYSKRLERVKEIVKKSKYGRLEYGGGKL